MSYLQSSASQLPCAMQAPHSHFPWQYIILLACKLEFPSGIDPASWHEFDDVIHGNNIIHDYGVYGDLAELNLPICIARARSSGLHGYHACTCTPLPGPHLCQGRWSQTIRDGMSDHPHLSELTVHCKNELVTVTT